MQWFKAILTYLRGFWTKGIGWTFPERAWSARDFSRNRVECSDWIRKNVFHCLCVCALCGIWLQIRSLIFFLTLSFLSPQLLEAFLMLSSIYNYFFRVLPTSSGELRHMKCMLPPFLCVECPSSLPSVKTNLQFPNKCPSEFQLRWSFLMLHLKQNVLGMPSTSVLVPCPPTSSLSILF